MISLASAGYAQPGGQAEGRDAVSDAEVGGLGVAPLVGRHLVERLVIYLGGSDGVYVIAVVESLKHNRVVAEIRQ